jgi:hypothetical protein
MLSFLISSSILAADPVDSITVPRPLLEKLYAKVSLCQISDSLLAAQDSKMLLLELLLLQKDSVIVLKDKQLSIFRDLAKDFQLALEKKKPWYNNVYVGFIIGAGTIYLSSQVLSALEDK